MVFMTSRSPLPARLQPQQSRIRSISPKTEQMGTKLARLDTFTVWFAAMTHIGDLDQSAPTLHEVKLPVRQVRPVWNLFYSSRPPAG